MPLFLPVTANSLKSSFELAAGRNEPGIKNNTCCMPSEIGSSGLNGWSVPCSLRPSSMKIHSGSNSPNLGSGLNSCQMISLPSISTPNSYHSFWMSPFGSGWLVAAEHSHHAARRPLRLRVPTTSPLPLRPWERIFENGGRLTRS